MHLEQIGELVEPMPVAGAPPQETTTHQPPTGDTPPPRDGTADDKAEAGDAPDRPAVSGNTPTVSETASASDSAAESVDRECPGCGRRVTIEHGFCPRCATEFDDQAE